MSISHMTLKQYRAFLEGEDGKTVASFPEPKDVRVLSTSKGTVVMVNYGFGGVTVIGDSIGVYCGEEAPAYFA